MIFKLSLLSVEKNTRQRSFLSSVIFLTLDKKLFDECQKNTGKKLFAECFILPRVFCLAFGKTFGTQQRAEFRW
jgi:hypothetical protein